MVRKRGKTSRRGRRKSSTSDAKQPTPESAELPSRSWKVAVDAFLELSKLESKKIRFQALKLVDELESEALGAFKIARRLELTVPTDPAVLKTYGRAEILERLRSKFASDHVDLAQVDTLNEELDAAPTDWYRQGISLLDCAETLNLHVKAYEYQLTGFRRYAGGRAPSVAFIYLASAQRQFDKSDEQVARSLVDVGFIPSRETFVVHFKENVIKKHRLRWLARLRAERDGQ